MKLRHLLVMFALCLALMLALLWGLRERSAVVRAKVGVLNPTADPITVCLNPGVCDYSSVKDAVDAAQDGDLIKVAAGTYSGVNALLNIVNRSITIQGGYTVTNWTTPDPTANPTTLDAQRLGQVVNIGGVEPGMEVTIEGLRITGGYVEADGGGGVKAVNASVTLRNNRVFENEAHGEGKGGGVYLWNSDDATLSGNTIVSNTAGYGGGLFLNRASATMSDNTISANTAITRGGGLLLFESDDATVSGNTVSANIAKDGGGVYLDGSDATVSDNDVVANMATRGGGLYLEDSSALLFNNIVVDNDVNTTGGGFHITASSPRLFHNTLVHNSGNEGVYVTGNSNVELANTILSTHTVGIRVAGGSNAFLDATLWFANTDKWAGAGRTDVGARNYTGIPDFVAPGDGDYHIGNLSAALDTGVGVGVDVDMDGEQRPRGSGYDIGADEFPDLLGVTKEAKTKPAQAGEQLVYVIRITNFGSIDYTAAITDILPENVTPVGLITWTSEDLSPEVPWERQITVTVDVGYRGSLTNTVVVTTDEGETGAAVFVTEIHVIYLPTVLRES